MAEKKLNQVARELLQRHKSLWPKSIFFFLQFRIKGTKIKFWMEFSCKEKKNSFTWNLPSMAFRSICPWPDWVQIHRRYSTEIVINSMMVERPLLIALILANTLNMTNRMMHRSCQQMRDSSMTHFLFVEENKKKCPVEKNVQINSNDHKTNSCDSCYSNRIFLETKIFHWNL